MSQRPARLVVVAGTGTEIGKTWCSVALAETLVADRWTVAARKPAQSGLAGDASDADLLAAATGEPSEVVCAPHRSYTVPMAPPMAAEALGLEPPSIADLAGEVSNSAAGWGLRRVDVGLVELAGGVASPAAADGDGADLAAALEPDGVVIVADAELGTINAVRLSVDRLGAALESRTPIIVFLNRFDATSDLHCRNREWLVARDGFEVVTEVGDLAAWVLGLGSAFCGSCGRRVTDCDGACARPLDPDRFCERCGRRLVVSISPAGHRSRCKVHG